MKDWKHHGVRIVHADELDTNTPQTPGMNRAAAITHARAGASKLWAGTVTIHPNAKPERITTASLKASSTSSKAALACVGAIS